MNCKTEGCPYPKVIDSKYCSTCLYENTCKTEGCSNAALQSSKFCKEHLDFLFDTPVCKSKDEYLDANCDHCLEIVAGFGVEEKPAHYQKYSYTRKLTQAEIEAKEISIKMDPYRICDIYEMKGGPREQITKKGLRWTDKDHSERQVIKEIMQACERRIEMMDEDGIE
jgi:hypothetical protein